MKTRETVLRTGCALLLAAALPVSAARPASAAPREQVAAHGTKAAAARAAALKSRVGPRAGAPESIRVPGRSPAAARVRPPGAAGSESELQRGPVCRAPAERPLRAGLRPQAAPAATLYGTPSGSTEAVGDLTAAEVLPSARLTKLRPSDDRSAIVANGNTVFVVGLEETRLYALRSSDGGATFGGETTIAGAASQKAVMDFSVAIASNGRAYVAATVVDTNGQHGLQVVRTTTSGTWQAPVDVLATTNVAHGVASPVIAAGPGDLAAVAFLGQRQAYPYAVVTTDGGANWSAPKQLDLNAPLDAGVPTGIDVAIDTSSRVFAVYAQDRGEDMGTHVYSVKLTNGGNTVGTEVDVLGSAVNAGPPDVAIGNGATQNVMVAFYDAYNLNVVTSLDGGATFTAALTESLVGDLLMPPRLFTASGTQTVLLLFAQGAYGYVTAPLDVYRSADAGASFAWPGNDPLGEVPLFGQPRYEAVRNGGTRWTIAWADGVRDYWFGMLPDLLASESLDDGVSWAPNPTFADGEADGTNQAQWLGGIAPGANGTTVAAFADGRADRSQTLDTWTVTLTSGTSGLSAGTPRKLDPVETASVNPRNYDAPAVFADRDGMVYLAYTAFQPGPLADLYVARSYDGGYTFEVPVKVGTSDPNSVLDLEPTIAATRDGYVYVAWQIDDSDAAVQGHIGRYVRVNSSSDYGRTWKSTDVELGAAGLLLLYDNPIDFPNVQVAPGSGATVYVLWTDGYALSLHKSTNGGTSFTPVAGLTPTNGYAVTPRLCVAGNRVIVVATGLAPGGTGALTIFAQVSNDGGATWGTQTNLAASPLTAFDNSVFPVSLACDSAGNAVMAWSEDQVSTFTVRSRRFNGSSWAAAVTWPAPAGAATYLPALAFTSGTTGLVGTYAEYDDGGIYAVRSTDGGATFVSPATRLNNESGAYGVVPQISSDAAGRAFVHWLDYLKEPNGELLGRRTGDSGATWDATTYRLDRRSPAGGFPLDYGLSGSAAANANAGHVAFLGWRSGQGFETVVQTLDSDDLARTKAPYLGDADENGVVDGYDLVRLGVAFGGQCRETRYRRRSDLDHNCLVDGSDLSIMGTNFGKSSR